MDYSIPKKVQLLGVSSAPIHLCPELYRQRRRAYTVSPQEQHKTETAPPRAASVQLVIISSLSIIADITLLQFQYPLFRAHSSGHL